MGLHSEAGINLISSKMLRVGPTPETEAYNDYVEACRAWGRAEKAKLGL